MENVRSMVRHEGGALTQATPEKVLPRGNNKEFQGKVEAPQEEESQEKHWSQDPQKLQQVLQKTEKLAQIFDRQLRFEVLHEAGDVLQVQVIDTETDKVVRKIPPDEVVHMMERMQSLVGAIFDMEG